MVERREDGTLGGTPPFTTPPPREGVPFGLPSVLTVDMELRCRREIFSLQQHELREDKRKRSPCFSKAPPPLPDLMDDYEERTSDLPLFLPAKKKSRRQETIPSKMLQRRSKLGDSSSILILESTDFTTTAIKPIPCRFLSPGA